MLFEPINVMIPLIPKTLSMAIGFGRSEKVSGLFGKQMRDPFNLQPADLPLIAASSAPVTALAGPLNV